MNIKRYFKWSISGALAAFLLLSTAILATENPASLHKFSIIAIAQNQSADGEPVMLGEINYSLCLSPKGQVPYAKISHLLVSLDKRGSGIGRRLFAAAIMHLRACACGLRAVYWTAKPLDWDGPGIDDLVKIYEKFGGRVYARYDEVVSMILDGDNFEGYDPAHMPFPLTADSVHTLIL
jgi:GNAT superfamily N-acetyltransferase